MSEKLIEIDLSGCKNWKECMVAIKYITEEKIKIKINDTFRK